MPAYLYVMFTYWLKEQGRPNKLLKITISAESKFGLILHLINDPLTLRLSFQRSTMSFYFD